MGLPDLVHRMDPACRPDPVGRMGLVHRPEPVGRRKGRGCRRLMGLACRLRDPVRKGRGPAHRRDRAHPGRDRTSRRAAPQ
ncbi:hypothetical protein Val02_76210 [Virgisporangium aliadipatigenens]|uniref:Uncharacterized protein n=1 Tax=Virgisporangium aliadipatigenens TaxID=741659 RepID=A0A8J3YVU0_9ACTN|nr:hypothetical protein Val02_76210 [Virgisporangium aliadipatigenens]